MGDIIDDFLPSDLRERIQRPEKVSVEKLVEWLIETSNVEVEIHEDADFVVNLPCGDRHVTDVKVSLTNQTAETKRRYELQVAAYAYLFEQQEESNDPVETLGVEPDTITSLWPTEIIERRISRLLD